MIAKNRFYKSLFIQPRIFLGVAIVVVFYFLAFFLPQLDWLATLVSLLFLAVGLTEIVLLFAPRKGLELERKCPEMLSLGDHNRVNIEVNSNYTFPVQLEIIDEIPFQLEMRDFLIKDNLANRERKTFEYEIRPFVRGEYDFGAVNAYVSTSFIGFFHRRYRWKSQEKSQVYPSVIHMKEMELRAFSSVHELGGIKKMRRIGHSYEFDQISEYVQGDDYRSLNWKATGRANTLMVNRYEDERSQPVYCIIDAGRTMKMPFNRLSLLDYAINSTLALSNILLKKSDKAGLITFSNEIHGVLNAANSVIQLNKILNSLYKLNQTGFEADYERLYHIASKTASVRGLLFLFTNFESLHALRRVKHLLNRLNKKHLLVVIFFENTEIDTFAKRKSRTLEEVYQQSIGEDYLFQKELMVKELNALRIQTILTRPEDLSIGVINKYLELKARGLI